MPTRLAHGCGWRAMRCRAAMHPVCILRRTALTAILFLHLYRLRAFILRNAARVPRSVLTDDRVCCGVAQTSRPAIRAGWK